MIISTPPRWNYNFAVTLPTLIAMDLVFLVIWCVLDLENMIIIILNGNNANRRC
jgi:hypothetical protein